MQNVHQYENNHAQAQLRLQWKTTILVTNIVSIYYKTHMFVILFVNWHNKPRGHSLHNTRTNAELTVPNGGLWQTDVWRRPLQLAVTRSAPVWEQPAIQYHFHITTEIIPHSCWRFLTWLFLTMRMDEDIITNYRLITTIFNFVFVLTPFVKAWQGERHYCELMKVRRKPVTTRFNVPCQHLSLWAELCALRVFFFLPHFKDDLQARLKRSPNTCIFCILLYIRFIYIHTRIIQFPGVVKSKKVKISLLQAMEVHRVARC
jgi:hypothetical protein